MSKAGARDRAIEQAMRMLDIQEVRLRTLNIKKHKKEGETFSICKEPVFFLLTQATHAKRHYINFFVVVCLINMVLRPVSPSF